MQEAEQKSRLGRGDCPRPCWLQTCVGHRGKLPAASRAVQIWICCSLPPIAVRRVSASTLALTRVHRQRLRNVCASLDAVCACVLRPPPSTAWMPRDAISRPNEATRVERGLALQSQATPDLLGGLWLHQ